MSGKASWTGLDGAQSTRSKRRSTFVLLAMGLPLALLTHTVDRYTEGVWRQGLWVAVEMLWTFWASAIVFVWWRPAWLRSFFLSAEKKAVIVAYAATYVTIGFMLLAIAGAFYVAFVKR